MKALRVLVSISLSAVALFAAFIGIVAYSDYSYLDCPGANQCSDALGTMQVGGGICVGAVIAIALIGIVSFKAGRHGDEFNA